MQHHRLLATASVAALILCPVAVIAQPVTTAPADAPAQPAPAAAPAPAATPAPITAAQLPPSPNLAPAGDLVATLRASTHFTILVKAIDSTNLAATLSKAPNLTLFAPTDEAFRALPAGQLDRLLLPANVPLLQKVVIYHLVNLPIESAKIRGAKGPVKTVANADIQLDGSGEVLLVNNADIIQADVKAANGVIIHAIDKVLLPSDVNLASGPAQTASTGGSH